MQIVNKICIVLYFDIILFYLVTNIFLIKRNKINSRIKYFPSKYSRHRSKAFPIQGFPGLISMPQAVDWFTGSDRSQSSVLNSMHMEPSEIAAVQISRTEYIMKSYHDMVDRIPPKRILWPWNQCDSHFYPRPVLAFGYCRCLRLSVCVSVCAAITCLSAW